MSPWPLELSPWDRAGPTSFSITPPQCPPVRMCSKTPLGHYRLSFSVIKEVGGPDLMWSTWHLSGWLEAFLPLVALWVLVQPCPAYQTDGPGREWHSKGARWPARSGSEREKTQPSTWLGWRDLWPFWPRSALFQSGLAGRRLVVSVIPALFSTACLTISLLNINKVDSPPTVGPA